MSSFFGTLDDTHMVVPASVWVECGQAPKRLSLRASGGVSMGQGWGRESDLT
jgi:hypothetical protein